MKLKLKQIDGLDSHVNSLISSAISDLEVEKIGYQGVLPNSCNVKSGMEFAVGTTLTGSSKIAQAGDYLIAKEDFNYSALPTSASDIETFLAHFIIVEQNISKINASAETNKYVSALSMADGVITATKTALPVNGVTTTNTAGSGKTTKAVVGIALSSGKVVATEKDIDLKTYPQMVETLEVSSNLATLTKTPVGNVEIFMNGLAQQLTKDYTVSGTKVTITSNMEYEATDVLVAVYNYAD